MVKRKDWEVIWGTRRDAKDIITMSDQVHTTESFLPTYFVTSALNINPQIYRLLSVNGVTKGMYALFPMTKDSLGGVLTGVIGDSNLNEYVVDYRIVREVYLYLHSFVVDLFDMESKDYTKTLVQDLSTVLTDLQSQEIDIKLVGAVASTGGGERITKRIGFQQDGHRVTDEGIHPVMYASVQDILDHIESQEG